MTIAMVMVMMMLISNVVNIVDNDHGVHSGFGEVEPCQKG